MWCTDFARRSVAVFLQFHLPGALAAYVPRVPNHSLYRALLSLRRDDQTSRGFLMLRCTERDRRLIVKCGLCRWLTTTQIHRLYFPQATLNAVQKRLRKLAETGYLRTYREGVFSEALHAGGPKGKGLLEEMSISCPGGNDVSRQLPDLIGVNDIRIAVESGTVPVAYFYAHWQLASLGWAHPVIPDAVFAVCSPGRRDFAVEYDRATESLPVLVAKLRTYEEGLPGFPFEAVVLITERDRRMDTVSRAVRKRDVFLHVLAATLAELQTTGIADCRFLELRDGGHHKLLDHGEQA